MLHTINIFDTLKTRTSQVILKNFELRNFSFVLSILMVFLYAACGQSTTDHTDNDAHDQPTEEKHEHADHHGKDHIHGQANEHMHDTPFPELVKRFESPERDSYQRPDLVLKALGDLERKKVMDLGAGTGYFSVKFADAGANVIAADVDLRFLEYIEDRKSKAGYTDEQLETRKVPYDSPGLESEEIDLFVIVNTYHHIEDRVAYFAKVKAGLKSDGKAVIIDFFKRDLPVGPSVEMKLAPEEVIKELREAGFSEFSADTKLLEYQYIITAK
ncbi:MAG: SAM-dependent methyltransferase [Limisphaerales bacterium]|jgi:SAM-dependent methyltransferase